jgi:hypothetical protein
LLTAHLLHRDNMIYALAQLCLWLQPASITLLLLPPPPPLLLLLLPLLTHSFTGGTWYQTLKSNAQANNANTVYGPGVATYTYPVTQRPTQTWYHDHV